MQTPFPATGLALSTLGDEPISILGADGSLHGSVPMSKDQILEALRLMELSQALDEMGTKLQRMGRIGLYTPVLGQEAAVIGSAMALDTTRDWMAPASREQPAMLRHGWPLENLLAGYMGRAAFSGIPDGVKLLPRQQAIAAQLPHAVGIAWSLKLRGHRGVTLVYCGDGASSEGDFHEALNFAGVMQVPLVIIVINNGYAISVPYRKQSAAKSLADRGPGYGMPGIWVDGNDVFAVYSATASAVDRALNGGGPTLIECRTYRLSFHNTSDNPRAYRDDAEVEAAKRIEPVTRLEQYSLSNNLCSESYLEETRQNVRAEIQEAMRKVSELPRPQPSALFENVYEELPPSVKQQLAEVMENTNA